LGIGEDLKASEAYAKKENSKRAREAVLATVMQKRDWVRRAQQFAHRYFKGNVRHMTHCLKRVHNCKLWEDLQREYKQVDWTKFRETEDGTENPTVESACSGGSCSILASSKSG
jgi:ribonucleoside-diphosphate reductase alpha chain